MIELAMQNTEASVVSMICDGGEQYLDSYYNDAWQQENGFSIAPYSRQLECFYHRPFYKRLIKTTVLLRTKHSFYLLAKYLVHVYINLTYGGIANEHACSKSFAVSPCKEYKTARILWTTA